MPVQGMKKAGDFSRRGFMAHADRAWLPLACIHDAHGEQAANEGADAQGETRREVCGAADKNGAVLNRGMEVAHLGHRIRDSGITGVGGEIVGGDFEGLFYRGAVLRGVGSVSYTHLDVYKRQGLCRFASLPLEHARDACKESEQAHADRHEEENTRHVLRTGERSHAETHCREEDREYEAKPRIAWGAWSSAAGHH